MGDEDDLDWQEDELEATKVTESSETPEEHSGEFAHGRPYLVLLTGSDVGRTFQIDGPEIVLGRSQRANIRMDDDSISRMHCKLSVDGHQVILEDLGSCNGTYVNDRRVEQRVLCDGDKIRIGEVTVLKFSFHDRLEESFQGHMYDAALRDGLTRTYNKRYFIDHLTKEIHYAARHRTPLCLIMLDIDHFKELNDTYGHLAGDDVLVQVAALAAGLLRSEDVLARYGGEEFGLISRGTTLDNGRLLAERLRRQVESAVFQAGDQHLRVTLSLGVAGWSPKLDTPNKLIEAADQALYRAKRSGRNRVMLEPPEG